MTSRAFSTAAYRDAARSLAATGQRIYQHGWSPATSSNYSQRLNQECVAITCSGKDKGLLCESDIMVVDMAGAPLTDGKPSAETGLHTQLYRQFANANAVLHTHSHAVTVLTMHWPGNHIFIEGYELLKALEGINSHDTRITVPIFDNSQDIDALAAEVSTHFASHPDGPPVYLIRGHGLYTWASSMAQCFTQLEALEALLAVELERRRLR